MGTHTKLIYHLVFSTKNRAPLITPEIETSLYTYLAGILKGLGGSPIEINGIEDHLHTLTTLKPYPSVSDVLKHLKGSSSAWINREITRRRHTFAWQKGYGAFTVSPSQLNVVQSYVRNQKEHHRKEDYQTEFRELLRKHGIEFDERYIWD